ncbi:hypothetical protein ACFRI7_38060 [Streptomyces sp. NPDC056716]|uniref:hypothetical protein n=1 Tax=unclassified Streptomyces TaxID=2593676 RepID=UPI00368805B4
MGQYVTLAAAVIIGRPRLEAYLRAPVRPASTWGERDWAGLCAPWSEGRRYREELSAAVAECDRWTGGDHAGLLSTLAEDDVLSAGYDPDSGSLALDADVRVDFRLPGLIWACTALRGMASFLTGEDAGLVTVTADWDAGSALLRLLPGRSAFLDRERDAAEWARARDLEFEVRCAVPGAVSCEVGGEVGELLARGA